VYGRVANDNGAVSLEVSRIEVLGKKAVGEAFALRFVGLKYFKVISDFEHDLEVFIIFIA
jgi:hypothetical protein